MFKKLFTSILLTFCFAVFVSATPINVASIPINDWNFGGTTATLRIVSNDSFFNTEGRQILRGSAANNSFYKTIPCTVSGTTLSCAAFTIDSTVNSSDPQATYSAYVYDAKGVKRSDYLLDFKIPTSLGNSITWAQISTYSNTAPRPPNPTYPTTDQVNSLIQQQVANVALPDATTAIKGKVKLSATGTNTALAITDPLLAGYTTSINALAAQISNLPTGGTTTGRAGETVLTSAAKSNNATLLDYAPPTPAMLSQVAISYENAVRSASDITATISINDYTVGTITIPGYGGGMNAEANAQRDVGRVFAVPFRERLRPTDRLKITLSSPTSVALRATVFADAPRNLLADPTLANFRPHLWSGPLSNDNFPRQTSPIVTGTGVDQTPLAAPQNNGNIIKDPSNGSLYQVTSFFSRDEQHGGGRSGNNARLYLFKATAPSPPTPTPVFGDDFNANTGAAAPSGYSNAPVQTAAQTTGTTVLNQNSRLEVTVPNASGTANGRVTTQPFDFSNGRARVKVSQVMPSAGDKDTIFYAFTDNSNYYRIVHENGTLYFQKRIGGADATVATIAYNAATHLYWQMRYDGATGQIVYETSANGATYTEQARTAAGMAVTALRFGLQCESFGTSPTATAYFDDFSVLTAPAPAPTVDESGLPAYSWANLGLLEDVIPGSADQSGYAGDPHLSIGANNKAVLVYDTTNGTDGFADFTKISLKVRTGTSVESLGAPFTLYTRNRSDSIVFCPRLIYRAATNDYLLIFNDTPEYQNRKTKILILPNLTTALTDAQINSAPVIQFNNEEGGGAWTRRGRVYISTWQIPSINAPTTVQRVYSAPLAQATDPAAWTIENHSWWHNDPSNAVEDGGVTADAASFWVDETTDVIYVTVCVWSVTNQKNSVVWSQQRYADLWKPTARLGVPFGITKAFAVSDVPFVNAAPFRVAGKLLFGNEAAFLLGGDPGSSELLANYQVLVEITGGNLVVYQANATGSVTSLGSAAYPFAVGNSFDLSFAVTGTTFKVTNNLTGATVVSATIASTNALANLSSGTARWKFGATAGNLLEYTRVEAGEMK